MAEAAIKPPDDAADPAATAPVDAPAPAEAAAPSGDDLDRALAEFESGLAGRPTDQPTGTAPQANRDPIDELLDEIAQRESAPGQSLLFTDGADAHQQLQAQELQGRLDVLQSENQQLKQFVTHQRDVRDFSRMAAEGQAKLGRPDLPNDYFETQLLARAINDPVLQQAFDLRYEDPRVAAQGLRQIQMQLNHAATLPAQREMLQAEARRLNIALHSKQILRRAMIDVERRAEAHKPIDETATADHDAVVAAVRGASAKIQPEPPPNFGGMSDSELRKYTREHFGF